MEILKVEEGEDRGNLGFCDVESLQRPLGFFLCNTNKPVSGRSSVTCSPKPPFLRTNHVSSPLHQGSKIPESLSLQPLQMFALCPKKDSPCLLELIYLPPVNFPPRRVLFSSLPFSILIVFPFTEGRRPHLLLHRDSKHQLVETAQL